MTRRMFAMAVFAAVVVVVGGCKWTGAIISSMLNGDSGEYGSYERGNYVYGDRMAGPDYSTDPLKPLRKPGQPGYTAP